MTYNLLDVHRHCLFSSFVRSKFGHLLKEKVNQNKMLWIQLFLWRILLFYSFLCIIHGMIQIPFERAHAVYLFNLHPWWPYFDRTFPFNPKKFAKSGKIVQNLLFMLFRKQTKHRIVLLRLGMHRSKNKLLSENKIGYLLFPLFLFKQKPNDDES